METGDLVTVLVTLGLMAQVGTWIVLGWQVWAFRRWRAEVSERQVAETAGLLTRLCEQQREIVAAVDWLQRHEHAVIMAARGTGDAGAGNATVPAEVGNGNGHRDTAPKPIEAPRRWVGRCIRCAAHIQAERVQPYCAACYAAWIQAGKPERVETYCARCGRKTGATTFRRIRCDRCVGTVASTEHRSRVDEPAGSPLRAGEHRPAA